MIYFVTKIFCKTRQFVRFDLLSDKVELLRTLNY